MSAIPGEPLEPKVPKVKLKDGRTVKLKLPGLAPRIEPSATQTRGADEPPRDDPRPLINPYHVGF